VRFVGVKLMIFELPHSVRSGFNQREKKIAITGQFLASDDKSTPVLATSRRLSGDIYCYL